MSRGVAPRTTDSTHRRRTRLRVIAGVSAVIALLVLSRGVHRGDRPIERAIVIALPSDRLQLGAPLRTWFMLLGQPRVGQNRAGVPMMYWWPTAGIAAIAHPHHEAQARRRAELDRVVTAIVIPLVSRLDASDLYDERPPAWNMEFDVLLVEMIANEPAREISPEALARHYWFRSTREKQTWLGDLPWPLRAECPSVFRSKGVNVAIALHDCWIFNEYD